MRSSRAAFMLGLLAIALAPGETLAASAPAAYGLGREASAAEISGLDIDVRADGRGLPAGRGDVAQGEALFAAKCAACHGADGGGVLADRLVGGQGSLATDKPVKTLGSYWPYATTVFDYIRRAMPYDAPGSLTSDEVYAVTAYLLWRNGVVARTAVLDRRSLPEVRMPNRCGFVDVAAGRDRPTASGCTSTTVAMPNPSPSHVGY